MCFDSLAAVQALHRLYDTLKPLTEQAPTIFLFSLFREPLLGELLIFIFVPLSAKVQVFCL